MRMRQLTAATTLAATALLMTACGGSPLDGKNGQEVATAAADALEKAGAVHMSGTVTEQGEEGEVDLHLQGDDAIGSITLSGVELQLLSLDGDVYLQGASDFWSSFGLPEEAAAQLDGQWVIVPEDAASEFTEFSLSGIVDSLRNPDDEVEDEVSNDEVDGKDVVVVKQGDGSTLNVADDDPSYPLSITNEGDSSGTLNFTRFGEKEDITAPDDAVDLADLGA